MIRRRLTVAAVATVCLVAGSLLAVRGAGDVAPTTPVPAGAAVRANVDPLTSVTGVAGSIEQLQAAVAARPGDAEVAASLGLAYLQRGRESSDPAWYAKAEALLDRARRLDPQSLDTLLGLGSLALSRHAFEDALRLGREALALSGGFAPSALAIIGDAQVELGRYDEAFATIDALGAARPSLVAYARQSYAAELQGDLGGAIELMEMAVRAGAGGGEGTQWTRVQLASLLVRAGRLDDAEQQLQQALAALPTFARAEAGLGAVAVARGDLAGAATWYERAATHLPLPEVLVALGDVQAALGRKDAARASYALVEAQHRLFRAAGGDADLELAVFAADHGDVEEALRLARSAAAARPSVHAHDALAWALYRRGDCDAALVEARAANRLGSVLPVLAFHSGVIAACAGEPAEAAAALRRARGASPNFHPLHGPEAERLLATLEPAT